MSGFRSPGQTLYISEPDCELRRSGKWLRIEQGGTCLERFDPAALDHVLLFGDIALAPGAISLLLQHAVMVSFLDGRGRFRGRLLPPEPPTPSLREAQYRCAADREYALSFAKAIIKGKLTAAIQFVRRYGRNHDDKDFGDTIDELRKRKRKAAAAKSVESLRGVEGRAAAAYFDAFSAMLRREATFTKRTRRPATDPVNALLSFGYTMLSAEVVGQVFAVGLDPQVGFIHVGRAGRPSLALDLVEEFRIPVVDRVVLRCWNDAIITPADFDLSDDRGPWLTKEGRATFIREYDKRMTQVFVHVRGYRTTFRRLLHGQARAVAHCFRHDEPYRPLPVRL